MKISEEGQSQGHEDGDSILSEDIVNRSLGSDEANLNSMSPSNITSGTSIIDPENYLKYANDKFLVQQDVLEVVDRNERSFKHVAEYFIQQSSQLVNAPSEGPEAPKRLMHFKNLMHITNNYYAENKGAQGVPYAIAVCVLRIYLIGT